MIGLVVITQEHFFAEESFLINEMFRRGLNFLHIRKPNCDKFQLRVLLDSFSAENLKKICLHYYPDLAKEYGVGAIQINSVIKSVPDDWKGDICTSCHTLDELSQKADNERYKFLSPIYNSISKNGYNSHFSYAELRANREKLNNVVALGGISLERVEELRELGFAGFAILGSLWREKDEILKNFDKFAKKSALFL